MTATGSLPQAFTGTSPGGSPWAPFVRHAVHLAERGRWDVYPNPTVGAVLVRDGQVVAEGWHKACGEAHAEVDCLHDAKTRGVDPASCTLVVTLEPCNHHGKTPPCTAAILEAGIKHVVVGLRDPNPQAAGGADHLLAHGVGVEFCQGEEAELCRDLVADFVLLHSTERPYVILKMAATLDGRIATRTGHSQWVSGDNSRQAVQHLRAQVARVGGAVLVGGGTFRTDNPRLNVRYPLALGDAIVADGPQPLACIFTSRLPAATAPIFLLQERASQTVFLTPPATAASTAAQALRERGVRVLSVTPCQGSRTADLHAILVHMRQELHCPYVLCEGGGKLALSLLDAGLVDEFCLHLAPCILGDNASRPLFEGRSPQLMTEALPLRITRQHMCGHDLHLTLRPR